jgi:hypothetical protein
MAALYVSRSTIKSLWQEYRVYEDRLELDTLFGLLTIPFEHIETIEVRPSDVAGLLRGDLQLRNFRPALKVDWANFLEHVVIDRKKGWIRRVLMTPADPNAFKNALDDALFRFRQARRGA